jgi:hypothetical protein
MASITGRCVCGAITYECDADPVLHLICHCDDCQRSSGASFSVNVVVPDDALKVSGEPSTYETVGTDHGNPRERKFCPTCGSQLFTVLTEMPFTAIKAGTLDDKALVTPGMEIWMDSAQPWHEVPEGHKTFPRDLPRSG